MKHLARLVLVVVVMLALPAYAAAGVGGKPVKGARYTGADGPGYPLHFTVSSDGKHVDSLVVAFEATCEPGAGDVAPTFHFKTLSIKAGKFAGTSTDHFAKSDDDVIKIHGSFKGRKASGKILSTSKIKSLGSCNETVDFTAKAKK